MTQRTVGVGFTFDDYVVPVAGDSGVVLTQAALDTAISDTDIGAVTYLSRALNSRDLDEFVARVTNSSGSQIDPLENDVSADAGGDEVRTRFFGLGDGNALREVQAEQLDTGVSDTTVGAITYPARALHSRGLDEMVSRVTDSGGTQIDPLARQDTSPVTGSTSSNATDVTLVLGDYRTDVDWFVDVSDAATLTVEVRTSGGTWRQFDEVDYGSGTTAVEQYSTAFAEMRASVDQNLNTLEGSSKGV